MPPSIPPNQPFPSEILPLVLPSSSLESLHVWKVWKGARSCLSISHMQKSQQRGKKVFSYNFSHPNICITFIRASSVFTYIFPLLSLSPSIRIFFLFCRFFCSSLPITLRLDVWIVWVYFTTLHIDSVDVHSIFSELRPGWSNSKNTSHERSETRFFTFKSLKFLLHATISQQARKRENAAWYYVIHNIFLDFPFSTKAEYVWLTSRKYAVGWTENKMNGWDEFESVKCSFSISTVYGLVQFNVSHFFFRYLFLLVNMNIMSDDDLIEFLFLYLEN